MAVRSALGAVHRRVVSSACLRPATLDSDTPIVSFTFDDFPRSALTIGGEILKSHGCRGTYYAAPGLMGAVNHLGDHFQLKDLDILLGDGHELASHTFSHASSYSVSASQFAKELTKGRTKLEEMTGRQISRNFAFPYGRVTLGAKRAANEHTASSRGIFSGVNGPLVDLNLLRANSIYGDESCRNQVGELISENTRRKGWLIFYTHDVRALPSPHGCTPALLEFAVSLSLQQGAHVAPVADIVTGASLRSCT